MIVLDRIEGTRAILEIAGELVEIPVSALPAEAREGARLQLALLPAGDVLREAEERLARLRAAGPKEDDIDLS